MEYGGERENTLQNELATPGCPILTAGRVIDCEIRSRVRFCERGVASEILWLVALLVECFSELRGGSEIYSNRSLSVWWMSRLLYFPQCQLEMLRINVPLHGSLYWMLFK